MSQARKNLCLLYGFLAVAALIATWRQNIAFMSERGADLLTGFAVFWPALLANRATISITVDIFLFAFAASVWMVLEARRLGIPRVWLYVVFGILVAISVTYPLFLIARERRLAALEAHSSEPAPRLGDKLGLGVMAAGVLAFAVYCTLR